MGKFIDLTGKPFGKLIAIERVGKDKSHRAIWKCICECGNEKIINSSRLISGNTKSCGCYKSEYIKAKKSKHRKAKTRLYNVWCGIKQRCCDHKHVSYKIYGAEGKNVCEEWLHNFQAFYDWSMANGFDENAPRGKCTIERIDSTKGYSPDNCRWATNKEQQNNKRNNHIIEYKGKKQTLSQWSEELSINYWTLRNRIYRYGWNIDRALNTPVK